jgi:hypothetical protein
VLRWGEERLKEFRAMLLAAFPSLGAAAEEERLAGLRAAEAGSAWGGWKDEQGIRFVD